LIFRVLSYLKTVYLCIYLEKMSRLQQLQSYKRHLEDRYFKLLEMSSDYRFIDESVSDLAAFKAMKLREKLNQVRFLDRELTV
jgi:hypothetical protein